MTDNAHLFTVGDRLQIGREHATVRYIGEVIGQVDIWIGLEWDDPSRGKHNGCTGGHQYFNCVYSGTAISSLKTQHCFPPPTPAGKFIINSILRVTADTSGTFARQSKLTHSVQPRITLLQAVQLRYQGAAVKPTRDSMMLGGSSAKRQVLVALVGQEEVLERQGRLDQLVRAALIDGGVCNAVCAIPLPPYHHHHSTDTAVPLARAHINPPNDDSCTASKPILIKRNLKGRDIPPCIYKDASFPEQDSPPDVNGDSDMNLCLSSIIRWPTKALVSRPSSDRTSAGHRQY